MVKAREHRWWQNWNVAPRRADVESFWRTNPGQPARREQFYTVLKDFVARAAVRTVLDFGCGTGEDYLAFKAMGLAYLGVDVTPEMLAAARKKYLDIVVAEDDVLDSAQPDRGHAFVVSNAVLPHLPRELLVRALAELWRVTDRLLVLRFFGVDRHVEDTSVVGANGFIHNFFREETWLRLIRETCLGCTCLEKTRGLQELEDSLVVGLWKQ